LKIHGRHYRSIWYEPTSGTVQVIDQRALPFVFRTVALASLEDVERAICNMTVRGAPLIGVTAAYGLALALRVDSGDDHLEAAALRLLATRPTAVNLRHAVERALRALRSLSAGQRADAALELAAELADQDVMLCESIGRHGKTLLETAWSNKKYRGPVNVLTHCNAGWLATVDWGTALAPIYAAHNEGMPVHVWVDETRPRNQGALLTALELGWHGVPHTVIADNAGGHLMQHGQVDLCLVGADRVTRRGDTANKIGTYLKALAAHDNDVPFYVALPTPTIDWRIDDGVREIPIEERSPSEVLKIQGLDEDGSVVSVRIGAPGSQAGNPAFDVTPARLVTSFVTEHGIVLARDLQGLLTADNPAESRLAVA
jgi:methylthioribose-1-phosphate isomerase